jgi:hypothetical protein
MAEFLEYFSNFDVAGCALAIPGPAGLGYLHASMSLTPVW